LPSSPARGEDPRKKFAVILLLSASDTDLLGARAAFDVEPYRNANPARSLVDDLPALVEGADLAVAGLLGGRTAQDGGPEALVGVPRSGVDEIADGTFTTIASERGVA
jgi:hypothetical protein